MPRRQTDNQRKVAKAQARGKPQKQSVKTTGRDGQAARDEAAVRGLHSAGASRGDSRKNWPKNR